MISLTFHYSKQLGLSVLKLVEMVKKTIRKAQHLYPNENFVTESPIVKNEDSSNSAEVSRRHWSFL